MGVLVADVYLSCRRSTIRAEPPGNIRITVGLSFPQTHLEELDSDTGKHEIQQHGDQDDVADGFNGHEHTLDHVLPSHTNSAHHRQSILHLSSSLCCLGLHFIELLHFQRFI